MVDFIDYIRRWVSTKASNLLGNTIMTAAIITVTCYAVQKDVFESYSATKACLFSVLMCCIWCGLFNSIALFYSERDYLLDDLDKYLPVRTYVSANFFIQFFLSAVESVVCAFVFSLFFDFSSSGYIMGNRSLDFCVTFFLITLSADMLDNVKKNMKILHPLPRVNEIAYDVDENPHAYYIQQAGNGLFAREAIFCDVLGISLDEVKNDKTIIA
jgi:hypothetical protein